MKELQNKNTSEMLQTILQNLHIADEFAAFFNWDYDEMHAASVESEEFFWRFVASKDFAHSAFDDFQNYNYRTLGVQLTKTFDGVKITAENLLSDDIFGELVQYYEWYDISPDGLDATQKYAFCLFLLDFFESGAEFTSDTYNVFLKTYKGFYRSRQQFAEMYFSEFSPILKNIPKEVTDSIRWESVAEDLEESGKVYFKEFEGYGWFAFLSYKDETLIV